MTDPVLHVLAGPNGAGKTTFYQQVLLPVDLAVLRVRERVRHGGHDVPEHKLRQRYERLWAHVATAIAAVDEAVVYYNTGATRPFRPLARYLRGRLLAEPDWPAGVPAALTSAGLRRP